MDRLPVITLLVVGAAACQTSAEQPTRAPVGRVDAVVASGKAKVTPPNEFCDVHHRADVARPFAFPELAAPAPAPESGWRWINVWATWCAPCVTEMPMLERWGDRLKQAGHAVEFVYLSVDEDAAAVNAFQQEHQRGLGPRVRSLDAMEEWLKSLGLDADAAIPINVWVDAAGRTRCVRTGSLEEHHYPAVLAVVEQSR